MRVAKGSGFGIQGSESPNLQISKSPNSNSPHPNPLPAGEGTCRETDLRADLASLRFDAIKIRTFRGALRRVLDPQHGVPAYLDSIRRAAGEFSAAAKALSATEMARVGWPSLPVGVLVDEMRDWWDASRQEWSRRIHGFYRVIGRGVTWPLRAAWDAVAGPQSDPLAVFQRQERAAIVMAVEKLLDELDRLAQVGNNTLRPRLMRLLGGRARANLLERVQAAHESLPAIDEDYRAFLRGELEALARGEPPGRAIPAIARSRGGACPAGHHRGVVFHRPAFCGRPWRARRRHTPPAPPPAISPPRPPSPAASPAAARPW